MAEGSHGVAVYPVIACEDILSRERVFLNVYGEELARLPAPKDYDPRALAFELYPYLATAAASDEWAQMLIGWHDPARVVIRYALLPSADLPQFVANALSARFATKSKTPTTRMAYVGLAVTNLTLTAIEALPSGMRLTVAYPDSYSNSLDFFSIADICGVWWTLAGTSAVSAATNWIEWTDASATNAQTRFYRVGDGVQDTDEDSFTDARELLLYNSDPEDDDSFPVTVAGTVTHGSTPQTGPVYVVAVTASNSWDTGRSKQLAAPGSYTITEVPNLQDYWVRAWRDWCPNGQPDLWEATGTATNCPIYLTNAVSNVVVVLTDPAASISGSLSYTGRQDGVIRVVAVTSSGSWSTADGDTLTSPGAYHIPDLGQTNYWVKAWVDEDADTLFDTNREANGAWSVNAFFLSNSVWAIDFALTDVDGDVDGMPDWWELTHFSSTNQTAAGDFDGDQMPNGWEYTWDFCPTNAADAMDDRDGDGYFNVYEYKHGSNPSKAPGGLGGDEDAIPAPSFTLTPSGTTKIQTALNNATTPYDIILLAAGTYSGVGNRNLDFPTNPVLLISQAGAATCVIDCQSLDRGLDFEGTVSAHTGVHGIAVRNGSKSEGAGVRCKNGAEPTVAACIVSNCTATGDGGGILCDNANPEFRACVIVGNTAGDEGGGVRCKDGSAALFADCVISNNTAVDRGGGMHWSSSTGTVTACAVVGNRAGNDGGGIASEASSVTIGSTLVSGNIAEDNGGGLFCEGPAGPVMTGCLVEGNRADDHGGGAYLQQATGTLNSSTFRENRGVDGGGISASQSATITNVNSVLWGNTPDQLAGPVTSGYSCVQGGASGSGIVTNPPQLTPLTGRLTAASPCIGAGTNAVWMSSATDIDNEARIGGTRVDVGADEFVDTDSDAMADAWELLVFGDLSEDGTADGDADGLDNADEFAYDSDPGDADTDGDGATDGEEVDAASAPATAATNALFLVFGTGDTLGGSKSERYVLTIENDGDNCSVTNGFSNLWFTSGWFDMGETYTITLVHPAGAAYSTYPAYPPPDYDHEAYIGTSPTDLVVTNTTNGAHDEWIFSDGFAIRDGARFLGGHWYDGPTTDFVAEGTNATLYVLLTDIDGDIDRDGSWTAADDTAEASSPGQLVGVNWDDDNTNAVRDSEEIAAGSAENDLVELRVALGPTNLPVGSVELEITSGASRINIWTSPTKGSGNLLIGADAAASTNWTIGPAGTFANLGAFTYTNLWVEGITNSTVAGDTVIVLRYCDTNGVTRSADPLALTTIKVDIRRSGTNITGTTVEVNAGDKIALVADVQPSGIGLLGQWLVSGSTASPSKVMASYTQSVSSAVIDYVFNVMQTNTTFYWTDSLSNAVVKYQLIGPTWSAVCAGCAYFNVHRPSCTFASKLTVASPPVGVREDSIPSGGTATFLEFGSVNLGTFGITWSNSVTTWAQGGGELQLVQLANSAFSATGDTHRFEFATSGYVLDAGFPASVAFDGVTAVISNGATGSLQKYLPGLGWWSDLSDTPGQDLDSLDANLTAWTSVTSPDAQRYSRNDAFVTYLMYRPSGADSIWVTLSKMTWYWSGSTTNDAGSGGWLLVPGSGTSPAVAPAGSATYELPLWSNYFYQMVPTNTFAVPLGP